MNKEKNLITVIIPTHNRAKELKLTLPSYMKNRLIKKIIVVNNGSTDNTSTVIASFAENCYLIKEIKIDKKTGAQKARMSAISQADTDYILLGEDDVYLASDYTETLYNQLKSYSCGIISGKLIDIQIGPSCKIEDHIKNLKHSFGFPIDYKPLRISHKKFESGKPVEVPHTHAIALVKDDIFNNISFDPWYSGNGYREETDFFLSAREVGAKIFFTPDTSCYHLRGAMSKKGGQRTNRLATEFWAVYNTWYMLRKHWNLLSSDFNLKYGPLFNTLLYFSHRECYYLSRLLKRQF